MTIDLNLPETPQVVNKDLYDQLLPIYQALHALAKNTISLDPETAATVEVLATDISLTVDIGGVSYKLLAKQLP